MKSLFFRIFIWFWATISVVGLILVILTAVGHTGPFRMLWRQQIGNALSFYGQAAVEVLERDGHEALENYLNRLERVTNSRVYLFGPKGQVIAHHPPSEAVSRLALEVKTSGEPRLEAENGTFFIVRPLLGRNGRDYVIAQELPRNLLALMAKNKQAVWDAVFRFGLIVLVVGILSYWLALYLTRPIIQLRSVVRRFAQGDLSVRVGRSLAKRKDEIGDLGRDFDFMVERIQNLMNAQRRLLRDISHELRSPLARLTVALELARQRTDSGSYQILDRIEREASRLNELIGQLLSLVRLESGVETVDKESIDLSGLVLEVVSDADYEAKGRHRSVVVKTCDKVQLEGNRELLRRAIENVLRNAVRYTQENTTVEVSVHAHAGRKGCEAIIRVRDYGPGVPDAALTEMFQPFHRVADARERDSGGVGLGLAIVDQAIRLHGGTVHAENIPGGGLVVEMRLPVLG